ncbi:hypothetical protein A6V39_04710 [Candidatus Mycoplasma haematobovis]|uniref:Uncharacterized protein n=1 Tax=Candidatus Mycoplasma haematobovis TaxID=432608 RepID=A0A1A9QB98_9MOLU|nr:hypothetical protein [Candidatus Mycoplasma haematobovis]OAL09852.1 hypothetical protein A6V39_04710 [Candidatus Mycoplasma haematobovis]
MSVSLIKWVALGIGGVSAATASTVAIINHKANIAEDALWTARTDELAKKIKAESNNWKKLVAVITGKEEEESIFKIENDKFKDPKKAKEELKEWCQNSEIKERTYNNINLDTTVCKFKK